MSANRVYSTFTSAVLTVTMNWFQRGMGIISITILARLLVPEDFGIIAMASLVVALADVLLNFGVHVPLIQKRDATQSHYNTAWTLRALQTSLSTAALFILAPFAADYFHDARVELVLRCISFTLLLSGIENIGVVDFQKHMQFGAEFRFRFLRRIAGFCTTITLAILLRSYWALVIGMLTEKVVGVVLSYWLHPMRPKPSFVKFREIFGVSQWMLIYGIGRYLRMKLHRILVGGWEPAATMGAYSVADDISLMPTGAVLAPVNRALFPAFSKVQESASRLKEMFLLAQGIQTLIAVPAAAGLAIVAEEIVVILLGADWQQAVPFLQVLALINIAKALTSSGTYILLVLDRARVNALFIWAQVIVFGALALTPLIGHRAMDVAQLSLFVAALGLWLQFWLVSRNVSQLRLLDILAVSIRPLIAAAAMAASVIYVTNHFALPLVLQFVVKVLLGASTYCLSIYLLWVATGRPKGAETYVFDKARNIWRAGLTIVKRRLGRSRE